MLHAGIDMHKEFLMVTVLDEEGSEVVSPRRIPTSGFSIEEFFGEFEPEEITACSGHGFREGRTGGVGSEGQEHAHPQEGHEEEKVRHAGKEGVRGQSVLRPEPHGAHR
jgi:hypothetical protein